MADVRDILELEAPTHEVNKHTIMGIRKDLNVKKKKEKENVKRPEGMHRELYALLYSSDGNSDLPPLMPTDTDKGYKSVKAKLGMKKVRPWKWMPFTNPARADKAVLHHWRRACDEGKEYPFAMFNKKMEIPKYTDAEYNRYFSNEKWTREETDKLFNLCGMFDTRWPVVHDRWPTDLTSRSIEDMKERYYEVTNCIKKVRNLTGADGRIVHYDAEHERKRKLQLTKLMNRTPEQYEEEQQLLAEIKKIEARKKEREKKTQDLQKLINASDTSVVDAKKLKTMKKKIPPSKITRMESNVNLSIENCSGIKFPDTKTSGVSLRSHKLKMPASVSQKKIKVIEQVLAEYNIGLAPMATAEICQQYNELRSDIVVFSDLRTIELNYIFELQTLKHQYENLVPNETFEIPDCLLDQKAEDSSTKGLFELFDSFNSPSTPNRKRKAALEQSNILKKIKQRT